MGWALGDGREHDGDPAWDAYEAEELYRLLENEIVPCFYECNEKGKSSLWLARMRAGMAELTPAFSSNRMLREYVERLYLPAAAAFEKRRENESQEARRISHWQKLIENLWSQLSMHNLSFNSPDGKSFVFRVDVTLGALNPSVVAVQLYADPRDTEAAEIHTMVHSGMCNPATNACLYTAQIETHRSPDEFTPRVIPALAGANVPLEAPQILWYR